MDQNRYFVRADFGSYAKEYKDVEKPTLSNTDGVKVLHVEGPDGEINLLNWDKLNAVTMKKNGGK